MCIMRHAAPCVVIALLITPMTSLAGDDSTEAKAERLFEEGRQLLAQGRTAEACARFEESHRLSPAGGTVLNLGECFERAGRVTSAWESFREAASRAEASDRKDAAEIARERAARLEPRLPRLIIVVETSYEPVAVKRDGEVVARELWGRASPVDPGLHEVVAELPGRLPFRWSGTIGEGARVEVRVPALLPLVSRTSPAPRRMSAAQWVGVVATAGGAVAVGVGVGLFAHAVSMRAGVDAQCPNRIACDDPTPFASARQAGVFADAAGVAIVAGSVVAVGGLALALFGHERAPSSGVRIASGPGTVGLSLEVVR